MHTMAIHIMRMITRIRTIQKTRKIASIDRFITHNILHSREGTLLLRRLVEVETEGVGDVLRLGALLHWLEAVLAGFAGEAADEIDERLI